jgi:hypothetical protein
MWNRTVVVNAALGTAAGTLVLLALTPQALAHRLLARIQFLGERKACVECWYDITEDAPEGATVRVLRRDGSVLAEGRIDADGKFPFVFESAEELRVVVLAGMGHATELTISADDLERHGAAPASRSALEKHHRPSDWSVNDVLTGVGFILAVAAFALSVRTARALAKIQANARPSPSSPSGSD